MSGAKTCRRSYGFPCIHQYSQEKQTRGRFAAFAGEWESLREKRSKSGQISLIVKAWRRLMKGLCWWVHGSGRGASCADRSHTERSGGQHRRENAGM